MKNLVAIRILGQQLTVRSDASADEALQVAEFVNRQLDELGRDRTVDSLQLAVMALLNISGAYLRLQRQAQEGEEKVESGLRRCLQRLDVGG